MACKRSPVRSRLAPFLLDAQTNLQWLPECRGRSGVLRGCVEGPPYGGFGNGLTVSASQVTLWESGTGSTSSRSSASRASIALLLAPT
jgi:hypothetical protein